MLISCYLTMQTMMKTKTESEEQDVWRSTVHIYSTNGLQMPGSDVAMGNSRRKKKKKQVPCSQEAYSQGMGQKIITQEELKTVT